MRKRFYSKHLRRIAVYRERFEKCSVRSTCSHHCQAVERAVRKLTFKRLDSRPRLSPEQPLSGDQSETNALQTLWIMQSCL